jgi:ribonucleoside-diphosphate reductase alpha chain
VRVTDELPRGRAETTATGALTGAPTACRQDRPARELWDRIAYAAWACADPGVQYDTTINEWHTCPAGGRINGSNPCSEYMFLDDTACNLASLNLHALPDQDGASTSRLYEHAVRLWTVVLEISVLMAQFPSARDRRALLRLPHPRPRLRQPRRRC